MFGFSRWCFGTLSGRRSLDRYFNTLPPSPFERNSPMSRKVSLKEARTELCKRLNILTTYVDAWKNKVQARVEMLDYVLNQMGYPCTDADTANESLRRLDYEHWSQPIDPVYAFRAQPDGAIRPSIRVRVPQNATKISWRLTGADFVRTGELDLRSRKATGPTELREGKFCRYELSLPTVKPEYYDLAVTVFSGDEHPIPECGATALIVAHQRQCYLPQAILDGKRLTGASTLLAGLRSDSNWGRGNYQDAKRLARILGAKRIDFFGLGPTTAVEPHGIGLQGPFNSNSRLAGSVRGIDPLVAAKRLDLSDCIAQFEAAEFQSKLAALRSTTPMPYDEIDRLIFSSIELLWSEFKARYASERTAVSTEFENSANNRQSFTYWFSTYAVLRERFMAKDPSTGWDWKNWPAAYRSPDAAGVSAFQAAEQDRIRFYQFTQWLVTHDLIELKAAANEANMAIGLYSNMPIGSSPGGADSWVLQSSYLPGVHMGVPREPGNDLGQDWGNPFPDRRLMLQQKMQPFRQLVQYSMQSAGCLEVDHGIGLRQRYAIMDGQKDTMMGVYIEEPTEILLGILALESHKNQCVVIAETLGTVPNGLVYQLSENRVLSFVVQRFEKAQDAASPGGKRMLSPSELPEWAVGISSNFNMETVTGFMLGWFELFRRWRDLNQTAKEEADFAAEREQERHQLMNLFVAEGLLSREQACEILALVPRIAGPVDEQTLQSLSAVKVPKALLLASARALGRSACRLIAVELNELFGTVHQLNVPNTDTAQWSNWIIRDAFTLDELETSEWFDEVMNAVLAERAA